MTDKIKSFDEAAEALAKGGRAPASAGEIAQRAANKAHHSERYHPPAAGERGPSHKDRA